MLRYIALAWNGDDSEQTAAATILGQRIESTWPGWSSLLRADGLAVFLANGSSRRPGYYRLTGDHGFVLGTLFSRASTAPTPEPRLDDRECERIVRSEGRRLIDDYWGRYVALVRSERGDRLRIIRDPSGAFPCFVTSAGRMEVAFSHVEDCARLRLIQASINWDHIASYLWFDHLVTPHTGLDGVQQVQAGECVTVGGNGRAATYYWKPTVICNRRTIDRRSEALAELRDVIQHCVSSWASCYRSILHELSGGLDSSIVLACLARMSCGPNVVCENHFTQDSGGDERRFAREAARSAGIRLIETPVEPGDGFLDTGINAERFASPVHSTLVPETQARREAIVRQLGIEAVFSGQGGDHYFQGVRTPEIAAEYASRLGIRRDLFRVIGDTSRLVGKPVWSTIAAVVTSGFLQISPDPYHLLTPSPLLSDAAREALDPSLIRHPWVDLAADLPGVKRRQIFDVIDAQNFYRLPSHYADVIHPLISQPLIEICLQIPSYILTYGGIDRALVRDAFQGLIPREIAARTTKGSTTQYFMRRIVRSLPSLRRLLLDGFLVEEHILDRNRVHSALSEQSLVRRADLLFPVTAATMAEVWVRSWKVVDVRSIA